MSLAACPSCARHVRRSETTCPFCKSALALPAAPARAPLPRLGRTATFAFGAALTTTAAACSTPSTPAEDTGVDDVGYNDVAVYGGPDGGPSDAGVIAEDTGGPAPAYGAPPDDAPPEDAGTPSNTDAGIDAGGGVGPLYGAPPA